ncbi:sensor histidine kinase [Caldicellulosiruptoraceae bacterium PP1]
MFKRFKPFSLNNLKVSQKLFMIYLLCVLLPILAINIIFVRWTIKNLTNQWKKEININFDVYVANIRSIIDDTLYFTNILYSDEKLNEYLNRNYANENDYFDIHSEYLRPTIYQAKNAYPQIEDVEIWHNNPTIPLSDGFSYINNNVRQTEWYKLINSSNKSVIIVPTFSEDSWRVSIIRKLDYYDRMFGEQDENAQHTYKKILKVDINLSSFISIIRYNFFDGELYLLDSKNHILGSNTLFEYYMMKPLITFDYNKYDKNEYMIFQRNLNKINLLNNWKIVGIFERNYVTGILKKPILFFIFVALISLIVATVSIYFISRSFSIRLSILSKHIRKNAKKKDFSIIEINEGNDEIGETIREFNNMSKKIKELIEKEMLAKIQRQNLEIERKQAEINALQSQINPHFLFNTLESIRMRSIIKNEKETAEIIKYLTKTLRRLIYWGNDVITIEDELKFIDEFLRIQNYRLGEKLTFEIYADEDVKNLRIPKMTIQPLVENSCIHGIEEVEGNGYVKVKVYKDADKLLITVEDNGRGMKEEEIKTLFDNIYCEKNDSKSIGLKNVYRRLQLFYNDKFTFSIDSKYKQGTVIKIGILLNNDIIYKTVENEEKSNV